jgi:GNAT superfamily N-acetyltransferase
MAKLIPVETKDDVNGLANIARSIWNEYFPAIIGQAQVDYMVDKFQSAAAIQAQIADGYHYFLAVENGTVAGYVGIVPRPEMQAMQISKFYLVKDRRGKGLARGIVDDIAAMARAQACRRLYLTVNKYNASAILAYEKLGFTRTGELETDIGAGFIMDDYEMELTLI